MRENRVVNLKRMQYSTPASSNTCTHSACPTLATQWSTVMPSLVIVSMLNRKSFSRKATSVCARVSGMSVVCAGVSACASCLWWCEKEGQEYEEKKMMKMKRKS
jgi:hypothetical protein